MGRSASSGGGVQAAGRGGKGGLDACRRTLPAKRGSREQSAAGADDGTDQHGGAKPRGESGGLLVAGAGDPGQRRQQGHRDEPGGAGDSVVDRGGDTGAFGGGGGKRGRGERRDRGGKPQPEHDDARGHLAEVVAGADPGE